MNNFKVGEVVVIIAADFEPQFVGLEATIMGTDDEQYLISIPDHPSPHPTKLWSAWPAQLRKRKPPETLVKWEHCVWQPKSLTKELA